MTKPFLVIVLLMASCDPAFSQTTVSPLTAQGLPQNVNPAGILPKWHVHDWSYKRRVATFITLLPVPVLYSIFVLDLKIVKWASMDQHQPTQMSGSFESLVTRVSPTVVEVLVTGYASHEEEDDRGSESVGRERSLGSGVIVDPDGYIVTKSDFARYSPVGIPAAFYMAFYIR